MDKTYSEAKGEAEARKLGLIERIHDRAHPRYIAGCEECTARDEPLTDVAERLERLIAAARA